MGKALTDFAMQAGQQALGGAMGLILGGINDRRQLNQQRKLQELEIQGQQQMTDYNYNKQLQMWKETNYEAQIEQLKMAGLNPGLLYGMGGSGGASTNVTGGNVSGAHAPQGGGEAIAMAQTAAQLGLMRAQKENIEADTANKKATTGLTAAQTGNVELDSALKELQRQFDSATLTNRESIVNIGLSKMIEEVKILENNREISDATKIDQIKLVGEQVKDMTKSWLQKQSQIAKTDEEKNRILQEIKNLEQEYNINKPDENMATDGANPKAGSFMKWIYMFLKAASNINKAVQ